jgi:alkanesulfonate monooxygenase SsuD/methylene tetrahydromethanopterin reductase-like flavin-dependent oxidoreductase (luciferase family)
MTKLALRLDMRAPAFAGVPRNFYEIGLDMAQWADVNGFAECMLSEHHGTEDGYLPSPLVYGAAIAARTQNLRIRVSALVLPLHDPLRIAEDAAVLDQLSGGRLDLVLVAGFRPPEYALFGRSLQGRGKVLEQGISVLRKAWSGQPFEYRGRTVKITPTPLQTSGPPILLGGSSTKAALRAARIGDGFVPAIPGLYDSYRQECINLGKTPADDRVVGSTATFVADDPDALWQKIAPHALHETNEYSRWYAETGTSGPYVPIEDAEQLRAMGLYKVFTPEQCLQYAETLGPDGWLFFHPLLSGLDPETAWQSLHLLKEQVLPYLKRG